MDQFADRVIGGYAVRARPDGIVEVRRDHERERRKGAPEIILGETKEPAQIVTMARALLVSSGGVIIGGVRSERLSLS